VNIEIRPVAKAEDPPESMPGTIGPATGETFLGAWVPMARR